MNQHTLAQDAVEDRRTLGRLGAVIGAFMLAMATMAIVIGILLG